MVERIKNLCGARNMSISDLEQECCLGKHTVVRWDKHSPSVSRLAKVARFFGVTLDYLYGHTVSQ